ncbi:4158_t:CDS:2, partial [Acaulospora colombiana]
MVHRAQDSRLLTQLLKSDKEYSYALNGLLTTSQSSLAALNAYASSCPPTHAQPLLGVVTALSAAEDAFKAYVMAVDAWRADLKRVRRAEEVVANVLRDREILIGKLIKVSNKKSTRDSVGLATPFANDPTLALNPAAINGSASNVTLTSGNAKLNHAQAELQACEAHLALKEKELETTREEAIKRGLERRCKALVTCGWAWGERGKQALRALDSLANEHSNEHEKSAPRSSEHNDSQLSSVTPSQSASQIAGIVTSDESPARSSMSKPIPIPSSPLHARQHSVAMPEPEPEFKLSIRPAHSIDDHDHIHDSIPSSKPVDSSRRKSRRDGDSSEEDLSKGVLQVHENDPFGKRASSGFRSEHASSKLSNVTHSRTLRRPDSKKYESPKIGFPLVDPEGSQRKAKHSSDLGPRTNFPSSSPQEEKFNPQPLHRKRSTSFSLMGGISGLFKGKKRSSSIERSYPLPTNTGGWHTRTDKNLLSSRRGRTSSSEEELPSTLIRKAKQSEQAPIADNSSINSETRKLTKRTSTGASRFRRSSIRDNDPPSKYKIVEQPVNASLVRSESFSSKKSDKISTESSRETARETAANTAMNAGTTRRSSMPPERTNSEIRGRAEPTSSRHQSVDGAKSLEGPRSELAKLNERLKKLEEVESELRKIQSSPMPVLSADKLEVVKAPPSIIQAPLLFHATPATSFGGEPATSPRVSTLKSATSPPGSPGKTPNRLSSSSAGGLPTSPTGGANLKARSSVSSRDSVPL